MIRRLLPLLAALGLLALGAAGPSTAWAGRVRASSAADSCNPSQPYPIAPDATVQVSTTNPRAGDTIKVAGIRYCPNEDVDIAIAGKFVGTRHTDTNGSFDPTVKVPGPAGEKRLCGIGASGLAADRDCLTIDVRAGGSSANPAGGPGEPAMTGVEIALLGVLALALVVAGVLFSTFGRRRKATTRV